MAGKLCPILSAGTGPDRDCIGNQCMMFSESETSGACTFVRSPRDITSRMDTLSAQLQEMQVALMKLANA